MPKTRATLMLVGLMALTSCVRTDDNHSKCSTYQPPKNLTTITWGAYNPDMNLDAVEYFINDRSVGRGSQGLHAILSEIGTLSTNSTVYIYPDPSLVENLKPLGALPGTAPNPKVVPLHRVEYFERAMLYLAKIRGVSIYYLAGKPGDYLFGNDGIDYRASLESTMGAYDLLQWHEDAQGVSKMFQPGKGKKGVDEAKKGQQGSDQGSGSEH